MDRREFLKRTSVAALSATGARGAGQAVKIVVQQDPVTSSAPVQWALSEFRRQVNVRDEAAFTVTVRGDAAGAAESFSITPAKGSVAGRAGGSPRPGASLAGLAPRGGAGGGVLR